MWSHLLAATLANGLLICATLTSLRGGHIPFVQAGAVTSDTGAEAVKLDQGCRNIGKAGGGSKKVEGNGNLRNTKKSLSIMLATVQRQC